MNNKLKTRNTERRIPLNEMCKNNGTGAASPCKAGTIVCPSQFQNRTRKAKKERMTRRQREREKERKKEREEEEEEERYINTIVFGEKIREIFNKGKALHTTSHLHHQYPQEGFSRQWDQPA